MRSQFVLDEETEALLSELSASRAGNRSFVVREAIRLYAVLENWLDTIEADPGLQQMMANSLADIEAGRVMSSRKLLQLRAQPNKRGLGGAPNSATAPNRASRGLRKLARGAAARKTPVRH